MKYHWTGGKMLEQQPNYLDQSTVEYIRRTLPPGTRQQHRAAPLHVAALIIVEKQMCLAAEKPNSSSLYIRYVSRRAHSRPGFGCWVERPHGQEPGLQPPSLAIENIRVPVRGMANEIMHHFRQIWGRGTALLNKCVSLLDCKLLFW